MHHIESEAKEDGSSEVEFMEEAGSGVALVVQDFVERYGIARAIAILAGKGNNGGDAYVAAIHLLHLEYTVIVYQYPSLSSATEMTQRNAARFAAEGGKILEVSDASEIEFPQEGIILDGIFGTGFDRHVEGTYLSLIRAANESGLMIISIDIPSGLNGATGEAFPLSIKATETAYLGLPKTGFFLRDGWNNVGTLRYVDFGLPDEYIEEVEADFILLTPDVVIPMIPKIVRTRHKYEAGLTVGLAGSPGMPGAALLASSAALRSGTGIVKLLHPHAMQEELGSTPLELVKVGYDYESPEPILELINKGSAVFIGPGMGRSDEAKALLQLVLKEIRKPCVIDADALTLIAEEGWSIPTGAIITPHRGELERLMGRDIPKGLTFEFLSACQTWVEERNITLVLKGAPTFVFHPGELIHVCGKGDPGMATAGTGDVLTGIIAGLLSQNSLPQDAARLGVFLHGLAGEHAAQEKTSYCMIASDLLEYLPAAFAFEEA